MKVNEDSEDEKLLISFIWLEVEMIKSEKKISYLAVACTHRSAEWTKSQLEPNWSLKSDAADYLHAASFAQQLSVCTS